MRSATSDKFTREQRQPLNVNLILKHLRSRPFYLISSLVLIVSFQNCSQFAAVDSGSVSSSSSLWSGPIVLNSDAFEIPANGTLQAAIAREASKASGQIYISGNAFVRSVGAAAETENVPANVRVTFGPSGRLTLADGIKLEIHSGMDGELMHRLFTYEGPASEVTFLSTLSVLPQWWGAVANSSLNATSAFRDVSRYVNLRKGGRVFIPNGTYLVGVQEIAGSTGKQYSYRGVNPIDIKDCTSPVVIEGESMSAKLRVVSDLKYGSFDPVTGAAYNPPSMPFIGFDYAASAYEGLINGENNSDVTIRNLDLDGNADSLILGGMWGDTGYQLSGTGIRLYSNRKVTIEHISTHDHPCDGIMIGYPGLTESSPIYPHKINDLKSERNSRNGFSWVGGNSMTVTNSSFNHSAQGRISSAPAAGLDIEAEQSISHNGYFENVEFVNNKNTGVVADSGNGGYSTFKNCLLWGTTALWPHKPALKFDGCRIYGNVIMGFGSADPNLATQFINTEFTDKPYPGQTASLDPSVGAMIELQGQNIRIEKSTISSSRFRAIYATGLTLVDVSVNLSAPRPDGDWQSLIGAGTYLERVTFNMQAPRVPSTPWYINTGTGIHIKDVYVTGPSLVWSPASGPSISGKIPDQP